MNNNAGIQNWMKVSDHPYIDFEGTSNFDKLLDG